MGVTQTRETLPSPTTLYIPLPITMKDRFHVSNTTTTISAPPGLVQIILCPSIRIIWLHFIVFIATYNVFFFNQR